MLTSERPKPRVLFVVSSLSQSGGAEVVFGRIIRATKGLIEPYVLVFEKQRMRLVDCPIYFASSNQIDGAASLAKSTLKRAVGLRLLAEEIEPDVIVGTQTVVNMAVALFVVLSLFRFGRRCVFRAAYDPFEAWELRKEASYRLLAAVERNMMVLSSYVGYVLFPSLSLKRKFETLTPILKRRVVAIQNFTDVAGIQNMATEGPGRWPEEPVIISVGRFDTEKNHALLVKAFARVRSKKRCKLVLVGEGQERDHLRRLAEGLAVSDDVVFLGEQSNPFKFMARAQVFALSSDVEGMPNVLIEALALGLPVVSTDREGCMEVLGRLEPAGILVPRRNVERMAEAILSLLDNPSLRLRYSKLASARARKFDAVRAVDSYLRLFHMIRSRNDKSVIRANP